MQAVIYAALDIDQFVVSDLFGNALLSDDVHSHDSYKLYFCFV